MMIDKKATIAKAKQILDKYREERGYAHMPINPRVTARISNQPVSTAESDPYALARVQRKEAGQAFTDYIDQAIAALPVEEYRWILVARYCDGGDSHHPDQDAQERLNDMNPMYYSISPTTYYIKRDKALLALADILGCEVY
ncbi:hypothetical protein FC07_GL000193 [Loigolactobacillus bifermentans DSM 20003]|uniref:Phage transcriptional regulator, ArpU family protein n=2 Tax=Loigolactobacillus bifermentans TaxID=1607 RepID=A0A0R1H9F5_9LACO|nr:hypothetical protein [Loigolactobacillus bifermentans]KRK40561.1 hypothetical protein FC07_GL000193 [Loigolactobacillus bifermentans DSM 20003]QGG59749.1 hypothetical protein LB003_04190 [Loigolactobacillus bifermentans]